MGQQQSSGYVNGAAAPSVNGASASDESDELAQLSTLPPPSAGDDVPLSLFNPDGAAASGGATDAAEDFLIDEVFSSL